MNTIFTFLVGALAGGVAVHLASKGEEKKPEPEQPKSGGLLDKAMKDSGLDQFGRASASKK